MIDPGVLLKVDAEGVPRVVQRIRYIFSSYLLEITLFDGRKRKVEPEMFLKYPPGLMSPRLSPEQLQDAYNCAEVNAWRYFE